MVTLQEATEYTKAPTGYGFAYKGRSTVLYDKDVFSLAVTGEQTVPSSKYGPAGGGISWGVLKDKSTGRLSVVFSTHLKSGDSKSAVKQRVYEAGKIAAVVRSTMAMLRVEYPKLAWDTAATFVAGDINSNKSRTTDGTIAAIEKTGWHDAFDQARVLVKQHQNSANGSMSTTPRLGITWGDHIDQVLVQPSKTVVLKWSNVQKMSKGKYVKLASDHLPIMVTLRTNP
jgi:endonuclease/exonuclease/phosphatase family metal-dependent hydrolase